MTVTINMPQRVTLTISEAPTVSRRADMTIQTEVRVKCPHEKCGDVQAMTASQFFVHLKDKHAVEELRWILTGIEERTDRDNRDHLVRLILRDLFSNALKGLKTFNIYSSAELKGITSP